MAFIKKNTVFYVLFLPLFAVFCHVEALDQCHSDSDCSYYEYCCDRKFPEDNVCLSNCIGKTCSRHSDCAPGEFCCLYNEKCTTGDCDVTTKELAGWIVAVIVISVVVVIIVPIAVAVFCCCCCC